MLNKKPKIKIDPKDPFKEDELKRSESAEILTQFLQSIDEPFVLAIDSGWGTGKITFIQMWEKYLQNKGFNCLYFNAWENDFSDDPLISFIGEMQSIIGKLETKRRLKAKQYLRKVKEVGYSLAKQSIPVIARIATSGVVDINSFSGKEISDLAAKIAQEKIDSYEKDKMTLQEFRKSLEKFVTEIIESKDGENKPLVFFIDELDRCKPTYAIGLLERLKHLFNVTGVVFVLALAKDEIFHSIESLYGKIDADGYLRRFIDLDYTLPDVHPDRYCRFLFKKFGFIEHFKDQIRSRTSDGSDLLNTFIGLSRVFNFSLRVQEQCFTQFSIVLRTTEYDIKMYPTFLAALISLKAVNKPLYQDYVNGNADYKAVLEYLGKRKNGAEFVGGVYGASIEAHMIYNHFSADKRDDICNQNHKNANNTSLTQEQKERARIIVSTLQSLSNEELFPGDLLRHLVKRIEISERFER